MKILMLTDVFFPRINGVSTSIETFRKELISLGHQVTLLAPEYPVKIEDDKDIIRIPSRYLIFDKEDRILKTRKALKFLDEFKAHEFDLIHIQTPFLAHYLGIKFSKLLNIPVIETYHTYFEEYLFHYLPLIPKSYLRYLARRFTSVQCNDVDHVIVPSLAMKEKLQEYDVTADTTILPTGLTTDRFNQGNPGAFMKALNIDENRPRLVHVGRIAHEKNINFIIDVLAKVKQTINNVLLIIAGEGPALKHIKSYSKKLGLSDNIKFVGYLDRNKQLLSCYQSAHAFLFSSKTETQGLVLLEAMAAGTPVVSTAIMGTKDILAPEKGGLVAEDDIEDFSNKVIKILSDTALQNRLAKEARQYAREWCASSMAAKQLDLYRHIVATHSNNPAEVATAES